MIRTPAIADVIEASGEVFEADFSLSCYRGAGLWLALDVTRPAGCEDSVRVPLDVRVIECRVNGAIVCGRASVGDACKYLCPLPKGSRCPDCSSAGLM